MSCDLTGSTSIIIPVYNEEKTIIRLVNSVLDRPEVGEVIIVNDASTDSSWQELQTFADNPRVKLFQHEYNKGKGAALIFGFAQASCRFVLVQDADFEYSPSEYPLVLQDMETCYKGFKREVIQNLNLCSERFGIEVELTAKVAAARILRIWQVPISYRPRRYNQGKKITWRDGIAAMWHIFRFNVLESKSKFYKKPWSEVLPPPPDFQ